MGLSDRTFERRSTLETQGCPGNKPLLRLHGKCSPPELWSVTMVFVSCVSNAILTLYSYSVKRTSVCFPVSCANFHPCCFCRFQTASKSAKHVNVSTRVVWWL